MRFPRFIKKGDTIMVSAPSLNITKELDIVRCNLAIKQFLKHGLIIKEMELVREIPKDSIVNLANDRALEFTECFLDDSSPFILCASGGDFANEVLSCLDFEQLKDGLKWVQGYSDITNIIYPITTILEIATVYSENYKSFGMKEWHESLELNLDVLMGETIQQESFDLYQQEKIERITGDEPFNLVNNVEWKTISGHKEIISGRLLGGCLDTLVKIVGTRFDHTCEFIEKYKNDGIVWAFDMYSTSFTKLHSDLWQMENAGWFKYASGFVFGRPLKAHEEYDKDYVDAIKRILNKYNKPIIFDACIGHCPPQLTWIIGSLCEIECGQGKGILRQYFL